MIPKHIDRLTEAEHDVFDAMVDIKIWVASMSRVFPPSEEEEKEIKAAVKRLEEAYYNLMHARLDVEFGQ